MICDFCQFKHEDGRCGVTLLKCEEYSPKCHAAKILLEGIGKSATFDPKEW